MPFKIGEHTRQIRCRHDCVKVVLEDYPSINLQTLVSAAILERLNEYIATAGGGKDRQPRYDGRGDEVSETRVIDAITTAHIGILAKHSFGDKCVPKYNLGTRWRQREATLASDQTPSSISPPPTNTVCPPTFTSVISFAFCAISMWIKLGRPISIPCSLTIEVFGLAGTTPWRIR